LFLIAFLPAWSKAQQLPDTICIATWNGEWWAGGNVHPVRAQVAATVTLLNTIGADFYALEEIVNGDSLSAILPRLAGGPWSMLLSPYASGAASPASSNYATAQKLALLYKPKYFRNLHSRPFLQGHPYASYDFASGRFPFLITGEMPCKNGDWQPVAFVLLHAKALTDASSCQRRTEGAAILKDSLDRVLSDRPFLLLGDFNDDLDTTICAAGGPSAYAGMVADSVMAPAYKALTLPISLAGARSSDAYGSLLDHIIASDHMGGQYVAGSTVSLRNVVRAAIPAFASTVSDHYPVRATFKLRNAPASVENTAGEPAALRLYPLPATNQIFITGGRHFSTYSIWNAFGQQVGAGFFTGAVDVEKLPAGYYVLELLEARTAPVRRPFLKR
jgi:hypothetical protein